MAGLEVLYACFMDGISCGNDAVVCFVHWELIKGGYRCIGSGDEARSSDKKSELLPADWSINKELYTLRYKPTDADTLYMLKGIPIDSALLFNFMNTSNEQVLDLVLNISDYVNTDQLQTFDRFKYFSEQGRHVKAHALYPPAKLQAYIPLRKWGLRWRVQRQSTEQVFSVYKDAQSFSRTIRSQLLPPQEQVGRAEQDQNQGRSTDTHPDRDPLRMPHRHPHGAHPHWPGPLAPPFAVGGADIDPLGLRGPGGMIMDPLHSGYPRSGFDPSGIPDILPPGAVPPGARFDPIGPLGLHRPGPDPDHMPPPGYDDM